VLRTGFQAHWPNLIVGYSYKTNALPWLINWMRQNGVWAEVVSTPEYQLAQHIGCQENNIILNGPHKGYETLRSALNAGAIVNIDHFQEVEWLVLNAPETQNWKIGLRLNLNLEQQFPGETVSGQEPGRFGFSVENGDFDRAIAALSRLPQVVIAGLHVHHSTRTKSPAIFGWLAEQVVAAAEKIPQTLEYIDMGGGFFGDKPGAPTYEEYGKAIAIPLLRRFKPQQTTLIVEPGAALAASCFTYCCGVIDVRVINGHYIVTTDGSMMQIDPQMQGRDLPVAIYPKIPPSVEAPLVPEQIICGYTCMERDRLARVKDHPALQPGDRLVFNLAGAYTLAFAPLFIEYYPAVYVKEKSGATSIIRAEWGIAEFMQKSSL